MKMKHRQIIQEVYESKPFDAMVEVLLDIRDLLIEKQSPHKATPEPDTLIEVKINAPLYAELLELVRRDNSLGSVWIMASDGLRDAFTGKHK